MRSFCWGRGRALLCGQVVQQPEANWMDWTGCVFDTPTQQTLLCLGGKGIKILFPLVDPHKLSLSVGLIEL